MFVQATTTLLENILSEPTHRRAPSDLKLIEPLLILLGALAKDGKNEEVATMYQSCGEMFEKTREKVRIATHQSENGNGNGFDFGGGERRLSGKGGEGEGEGNETLEEFLRRIESVSAGLDEEGMELVEQPVAHEESLIFPYLGGNEFSMPRLGWNNAEAY
jgi:hypothetical protein